MKSLSCPNRRCPLARIAGSRNIIRPRILQNQARERRLYRCSTFWASEQFRHGGARHLHFRAINPPLKMRGVPLSFEKKRGQFARFWLFHCEPRAQKKEPHILLTSMKREKISVCLADIEFPR